MQKKIDCIEMQRDIRNELLKESEYDLRKFVLMVKENNKKSRFYKILNEKQIQNLTMS